MTEKELLADLLRKLRGEIGTLLNEFCGDCKALCMVGEMCEKHTAPSDTLNVIQDIVEKS